MPWTIIICSRASGALVRVRRLRWPSLHTHGYILLSLPHKHTSRSRFLGYRFLESRVASRRVRGLPSCSSCTLSFRKLWLDFGGALDMTFQSSPAILNRSTLRAARQLHQILVEPLLLHLLELLFPLHCTGPAFQALALYLCLSGLDLAVCARVIETCERVC
jgi:hypothetical protein